MIVATCSLDFGIQLFRNTFARLLSEAWGINTCIEPLLGWQKASPQSRTFQYLGEPILIDGEWPRLVHLNQPLHPDFWRGPQRGHFRLTGQFRLAEFYTKHRERIKREWLSFETDPMQPERKILVCSLTARLEHSSRYRYCLRPTPGELSTLLPGVDFSQVEVLVSPLIKREALRPDYDATATKPLFVDQTTTVIMARQARVVVANLTSHAWWAGFLSFAEKTILLTYGGEDRPCKTCETALVGKPKLVFEDVTTRHVDLTTETPEA